MKKQKRTYTFVAVYPDTHKLITKLASQEGRTMYGMVNVMAKFYEEWRKKMELVIDDR